MTAIFDEKARKGLLKNIKDNDFKYNGWKVRDIEVRQITPKEARPYIAMFHYSKTFPDSTRFVYGGFVNDKLVGIVCYGMGCGKNQYTAIIPDIQNGSYVELTRVWCMNDAPRNTESRIIGQSLKLLPKEIKLVISFSDTSQGHCGLIYQATNWYYLGCNKGGKMLEMENGIQKHPRLLGIYRMRHPEYKEYSNNELMELLHMKYVDGGSKHRYVYLRGTKEEKKNMYSMIKDRICLYPKTNIKTDLMNETELLNLYISELLNDGLNVKE